VTITPELLLSLIAALGIGGIVGSYFQSRFQHRKEIKEDIHALKRQRYGAILIQMLTVLDPQTGVSKAQQFRPDLKNLEDFKQELKTEMLNGVLYASDRVLRSIAKFIMQPSYVLYIETASEMRKDLWGRRAQIPEDMRKVFYGSYKDELQG
jgi:hypothetical protein